MSRNSNGRSWFRIGLHLVRPYQQALGNIKTSLSGTYHAFGFRK